MEGLAAFFRPANNVQGEGHEPPLRTSDSYTCMTCLLCRRSLASVRRRRPGGKSGVFSQGHSDAKIVKDHSGAFVPRPSSMQHRRVCTRACRTRIYRKCRSGEPLLSRQQGAAGDAQSRWPIRTPSLCDGRSQRHHLSCSSLARAGCMHRWPAPSLLPVLKSTFSVEVSYPSECSGVCGSYRRRDRIGLSDIAPRVPHRALRIRSGVRRPDPAASPLGAIKAHIVAADVL